MKEQLEKRDAEMEKQGTAIELQAVQIKQLKAQCEQLGSEERRRAEFLPPQVVQASSMFIDNRMSFRTTWKRTRSL